MFDYLKSRVLGFFIRSKEALKQADIMLGVDFTKTNEQTGGISFKGESLHLIREGILNPYQHVMNVLGRIFPFLLDKTRPIACYRFGDATTRDDGVLSFNPHNNPCAGIEEALAQYVKIVPGLYLAEPKSFAPIINMAISTAKQNQGKQHILVIISNGPVHRDRYTELGKLSCQEQKTVDAIENARDYSLSIIMIGVGDKSGDMMRFFEDNISSRAFESFQVVNYTKIMSQDVPESR
ncbi:hypothetical protein MKW94_011544 [Papaver nudicaule]|uniref:Copine C-terminal domain-containing protein n=1 Tax=Papaver nudicaule TaxID=74823 RepID=A0AA41S4J5_PAPNU|nr:hypothetical protein [Papaver nudicaule]